MRPARRSFVLIAVLVVVGSALLITTGLLFLAQSEIASLSARGEAVQSRALAWSGVQAVAARLDEQRELILEGRLPQLDASLTIYETGSRRGVVRILPVGADGSRLSPEAARVDVNRAGAEALAATGLLDDETAEAVVRHRDETLGRPFASVAELLEVPGIAPEDVYGPLEDITVSDDARLEAGDVTERVAARLGAGRVRGLADVLTVFAHEPALQRSGDLRINLNVPWSEELGRRVDDRFGSGASGTLQQLFAAGTRFEHEGRIFEVLSSFDVPPEDWPDLVDALTTEPGTHHLGRLDLNSAPYEALRALPGVAPEQAAQVVQVREQLTADERATVAWPAIRGILPPETYAELGGRITTRSWTFRVRIAAGETSIDDPQAPLSDPVIYEAVIDLSDPAPRIAYLRDVTLLQTTAQIALGAPPAAEEDDPDAARSDDELDLPAEIDDLGAPDEVADDAWLEADWMIDDPDPPPDEPAPPAETAPAETAATDRRIGRWHGTRGEVGDAGG